MNSILGAYGLFLFLSILLVFLGLGLVWRLFTTPAADTRRRLRAGIGTLAIVVSLIWLLPALYRSWEYYNPSVNGAEIKTVLLEKRGIYDARCNFSLRSVDEIKVFHLEKSERVASRLEQVFFVRMQSEQIADTTQNRWEGRLRAIYQHGYGWNFQDMQLVECKTSWSQ